MCKLEMVEYNKIRQCIFSFMHCSIYAFKYLHELVVVK